MTLNPYKTLPAPESEYHSRVQVSGPGVQVIFDTEQAAESVVCCLNTAYRTGYMHAQADIRRAMGLA